MAKIDLDYLQSTYFTFDEPIELKGLKIRPITVKDWISFASSVLVLELDTLKNKSADIEILSMSYLKWLLITCMYDEKSGQELMQMLNKILRLCFDVKTLEIGFDNNDKPIIMINDIALNARDFDYFRKVIMFQNIYDYEDESEWSEDFRDALREYQQFASKGVVIPTLERQMVIVANERHMMEKEVANMTYRKFKMAIDEIKGKLDYQIDKTAERGGMVTFKQPIDDWIYKKNTNKYAGLVTDYEGFKDKIEKANG